MPLSEKHEEGVWVSVKFFIINCGVILGKIRYNERSNTEHRALNYRLTSNSLRKMNTSKLGNVCNTREAYIEK